MLPRVLQAALRYARRGWPVVPLLRHGKAPITKHGVRDATVDEEAIRNWLQDKPGANLGIACGGKSGLVVIDVDPRNRGDETLGDLERQFGVLPETPTVQTGGGGRHLYFRAPDGVPEALVASLGPGVDVQGFGKYVVVPPSVHPSGNVYAWQAECAPDELALAALPAPWIAALRRPTRADTPRNVARASNVPIAERVERARKHVEGMPIAISGRGGHLALWRVACAVVRGFDVPANLAIGILRDYSDRCSPPWSDKELLHKLESAQQRSLLPWGYLLSSEAVAPYLDDVPPPSDDDCPGNIEGADVPCGHAERQAHLALVPGYPTHALPEPLRSLVEAGSVAGLPEEYVAAGGLAALAYVALDCRIVVSEKWCEAPSTWMAVLGPASTGKSSGVDYGWSVVRKAEDELRARYEAELEAWRIADDEERGPAPTRMTRVVSDTTPEALIRRLAAAGPQVLVVDELRTWIGALGHYGANAAAQRDLGLYLTMWDGAVPLVYDRVGGDTSIVAPEPAVAIIGTLQVEDHRLLGGVETGLRARWLIHLWRPGRGAADDDDFEGQAPTLWDQIILRLARRRPNYRLHLTGEARNLWRVARRRWKEAAKSASPGLQNASQKADRQALKVALALAVGMEATAAIPLAAMRGAIAIVDYVLACWRAIPEGEELVLSRSAERTSIAVDRLAAWLDRRPQRLATRGDILRAQVGGIRTAATLDAVLTHYEATYPGSVQRGDSTARGGRRGVVVHAPRRGVQVGVGSEPRKLRCS